MKFGLNEYSTPKRIEKIKSWETIKTTNQTAMPIQPIYLFFVADWLCCLAGSS